MGELILSLVRWSFSSAWWVGRFMALRGPSGSAWRDGIFLYQRLRSWQFWLQSALRPPTCMSRCLLPPVSRSSCSTHLSFQQDHTHMHDMHKHKYIQAHTRILRRGYYLLNLILTWVIIHNSYFSTETHYRPFYKDTLSKYSHFLVKYTLFGSLKTQMVLTKYERNMSISATDSLPVEILIFPCVIMLPCTNMSSKETDWCSFHT